MASLAKTLRDARTAASLTQPALAEQLGLAAATISQRESAKQDLPGSQIEAFVKATGVPLQVTVDGWSVGTVAERPLPYYGSIPCGRPLPIGEEPEQELDLGDLSQGDWDWRTGFVIKAAGDSMDPVICDGDWLICRRQATWKLWDIVVVFVDDLTTVKQIRPHPDPRQGQCLAPVNESHGRMLNVEGADVRMYGLVLGRLFYQPLGR